MFRCLREIRVLLSCRIGISRGAVDILADCRVMGNRKKKLLEH